MQPCGAHLSDPGVDTCCNLCNVPHEKQQQEEVHRGGLPLGVFVFSEDRSGLALGTPGEERCPEGTASARVQRHIAHSELIGEAGEEVGGS